MGATDSKLRICSFCASHIDLPSAPSKTKLKKKKIDSRSQSEADLKFDSDSDNDDHGTVSIASPPLTLNVPDDSLVCVRCHGIYVPPARSFKLSGKRSNPNMTAQPTADIDDTNTKRQYLSHVKLALILDTLPLLAESKEEEHKLSSNTITAEYLLSTYLNPFFSKNPDTLVRSASTLTIEGVMFQVMYCYPPCGYINTNNTATKPSGSIFDLVLDSSREQLETFQSQPLSKLHCLPIASTLHTFKKLHNILELEEDENHSNSNISKISLLPYLKTSSAKQASQTASTEGTASAESIALSAAGQISTELVANKGKHVWQGEVFTSHGISWRVVMCVPSNGYVSNSTEIVYGGEPIVDAEKMTIRPVYESIPFAHRNYTPKQIKSTYIDPFFRGAYRHIDRTRKVSIYGVEFAIRESVPSAGGLITMQTAIDYMGCAIKRKELESMEETEDMEMAQKLQKDMEDKLHRQRMATRREQRRRGSLLRGQWEDPLGFDFINFEFPWNRAPPPRPVRKNGVNMDIVNRLPTFVFLASKHKHEQCRICLEFYSDGDDLRILPCFHLYHKDCIDTWLTKMSCRCPICKTSIVRRKRQQQSR